MTNNDKKLEWGYDRCKYEPGAYYISVKDEMIIPVGAIGFVYAIHNVVDNKIYIGKKNLYTTRKKAVGKRAQAKQAEEVGDKRKVKKVEHVTKESDWRTYNSSNKQLQQEIQENPEQFRKYILEFANSNIDLTYLELKYMFQYNVMECDSYNDNLLGKFYKDKLFKNKQ